MESGYRTRLAEAELTNLLAATGAVLIEGPKACGKTETARQAAASEVLLDVDQAARAAIAVDPALVLPGATPRLIDEWQVEPRLWNHVRREVDDRGQPGQFILTGSAAPADDATRHSGAGRISRMRMRPMSLFEAGKSTGAVSLASLFDGQSPASPDPGLDIAALTEEICRGGWPALRGSTVAEAQAVLRGYVEEVRRTDINRVGTASRRDPEKVLRVMESLARNVATEVAVKTIASDAGGAEGGLTRETVYEYLDALTRLFVIEDQRAWAPHLRSKSVLRQAPKRHFVDPSIAVALVRATPARLLADLNYLGFLFESLVVRDLRVYSQTLDGAAEVRHYRDNKGREADVVIDLPGGRWAAFEVKLGIGKVDEGAEAVKAFASKIDTDKSGDPAVIGVIVGSGYAYRRDDGVAVIPIGALGP